MAPRYSIDRSSSEATYIVDSLTGERMDVDAVALRLGGEVAIFGGRICYVALDDNFLDTESCMKLLEARG